MTDKMLSKILVSKLPEQNTCIYVSAQGVLYFSNSLGEKANIFGTKVNGFHHV